MAAYGETWACGDSASLTCQLAWTEFDNTLWRILSGKADLANGAGTASARADIDLASHDYRVQVTLLTIVSTLSGLRGGVIARKDETATQTYYRWYHDGDDGLTHLGKVVSGGGTEFGTGNGAVNGDVLTLEVSGSTIRGYLNDLLQVSATDTAIPLGRRAGITGLNGDAAQTMRLANWTAVDLAASVRGGAASQALYVSRLREW